MKSLSHNHFRQLVQAAADDRLDATQCADLDAHLSACAECRAYAEEVSVVEAQLSTVSVTRLVPSPSQRQRITAAIQSRYRRHQMNKQIFSFVGTLAAVAAAIVFFMLFGRIVPVQPAVVGSIPETITPIPETKQCQVEYKVQPGDTLSAITHAYHLEIETIQEYNNIGDVLSVGQTLLLPTCEQNPVMAGPTPTLIPQTYIPRYFTRAESDHLPLQPFQQTPLPEETPTLSPGETFSLTVAEAKTLAGYDVFIPSAPLLPELRFEGASYDPERQVVTQRYCLENTCGNGLTLTQYPGGFDDVCTTFNECRIIGIGAEVEDVQIGSVPGEYVVGVWNMTDSGPVWVYEPWLRTLRWQNGDMAFEVVYMGPPETADKDSLSAWVASLAPERTVETPSPIQELSAQAGFNVIEPAWLPEGYLLSDAFFNPGRVITCLAYHSAQNLVSPSLVVVQRPSDQPGIEGLLAGASMGANYPLSSEKVTIGGAEGEQGVNKTGAVDINQLCGGSQWPDGLHCAVAWRSKLGNFAILFDLPPVWYTQQGSGITLMEGRRIAESITGVNTIPADAIDPQRMLSIQDAEELLGIDILEPTYLPSDYTFAYASYYANSLDAQLLLVYNADFYIRISGFGPSLSLDNYFDLKETRYDKTLIHDNETAIIYGKCWDPNLQTYTNTCPNATMLSWYENGFQYELSSFNQSQETLIAIAKSLH